MATRANIIGAAVVAAVLALAGFLILNPLSTDSGSSVRQLQEAALKPGRTILRPLLRDQVVSTSRATLIIFKGQGTLSSGEEWSYLQSAPNPNLQVKDINGKTTALKGGGGVGSGGTLIIRTTKRPSTSQAQALLLESLNDPKLKIIKTGSGWTVISKYLVADEITWQHGKLVTRALFLRSFCPKRPTASSVRGLNRSCLISRR
jgi:hypothetical protein